MKLVAIKSGLTTTLNLWKTVNVKRRDLSASHSDLPIRRLFTQRLVATRVGCAELKVWRTVPRIICWLFGHDRAINWYGDQWCERCGVEL